jgi:hypothetical protein
MTTTTTTTTKTRLFQPSLPTAHR